MGLGFLNILARTQSHMTFSLDFSAYFASSKCTCCHPPLIHYYTQGDLTTTCYMLQMTPICINTMLITALVMAAQHFTLQAPLQQCTNDRNTSAYLCHPKVLGAIHPQGIPTAWGLSWPLISTSNDLYMHQQQVNNLTWYSVTTFDLVAPYQTACTYILYALCLVL